MSKTLKFIQKSEGKSFLEEASATAQLYEKASRYMPGGTSRLHYYFKPYPLYAKSGSGCYVTDVEGVQRLDFLNNMTSLIHGHCNPGVKQALLEQVERGTAFSEPTEQEVGLAQLMVERVRSVEKIRFANSGTEAVMLSIKLARAFTGRNRMAKFEGFYHGYYDYIQVSVSSTPANWGPAEAPASTPSSGGLADSVLGDILVLPYNNAEAVEKLLAKHASEIACLITDPLSNRAGFPAPDPKFLSFLGEITKKHGIVLISDEVISFRVAHGGPQAKYNCPADLTTFGKIMGGGLPVGAVGGRADIMALLDPTKGAPKVVSGGTFSGNPFTMAAGLAAMEQMTPEAYARLDALGERLRSKANAAFKAAGEPGQLTGDGSLFRITHTFEPIVDYRSGMHAASLASRMSQLHMNLIEEGVIISRAGLGCLSTPMGEAEVDFFAAALERAIANLPNQ